MTKFYYSKDNVELYIEFHHYENGQIAMIAFQTGSDELWLDVTVAIPSPVFTGDVAIKGYGDQEGLVKDLIDAGIILPPWRDVQTEFVKIPIATLSITPEFKKEG